MVLSNESENDIAQVRRIAQEAKKAYDEAVHSRAESQRQVNSLLERKHAWSDTDVLNFTSLVRADHASNHAVQQTKTELLQAESHVEAAFDSLMKSILHRYHEEQVWSDKIRSLSTYGSLIVLAVNLFVFLGAIVIVEPWKRKRLVMGLEERVKGMMETLEGKVGSELEQVKHMLTGVNQVLAGVIAREDVASEAFGIDIPSMNAVTPAVSIEAPSAPNNDKSPPPVIPASPSIVPREIVDSISAQLAHVSPASSEYLSTVDPHKLDTAVIGIGGIVLGIACSALVTWLR